MKHPIQSLMAIAAGALLLLWLFCFDRELFDGVCYSTVVVDRDGELLGARVADDGQWRFPPCDTLPEKFMKALVEFEDRRFFSHCGVSLPALARATWQNLRNGRVVSGGSTLSMQLIRLSRQKPRTVGQKLIEIFMATRLEMRYSKEEILRLYASHAPFGGNVVGIDAALWRYLGDDGAELSWAEAATLAVLQNAPSLIHLERNRDALFAKRNRLLTRLFRRGELSEEEYRLSIEEPLIGKPYPMPHHAPHLVEHYHRVNRGELTITSIDRELQRRVEELTRRWSEELRREGVHDLAAVVMEVKSGRVVAYVGNSDMTFEREGRWVDIARAPRSSGSILKPLLYAAALGEGSMLPEQLLPDVPTDFGGFHPKNFDGSYLGAVRADQALALSLNIPSVCLLNRYGTHRFAETLKACGFRSLSRPAEEYGLSLVLGGAEVRLVDVVEAYARMAACYLDPSAHGDFPLRDRMALHATFEALREVNRPDQLDWRRVASVAPIAWKTGTSYGSRDAWAVGITPRYVVGVWAGNADGSGVPALTGARTAGPILFDLFALLPNAGWFDPPTAEEGIERSVCCHSGYPAGRYCRDTVPCRLPQKAEKSGCCPYCREVALSVDGSRQVVDRSEPVVVESRFLLPPHMEYYYAKTHPEYRPLPPLKEGNLLSAHPMMQVLYPLPNSVLALPRQSDGSPGHIVCKAAHTDPNAELFWHLDNAYIGSTTAIHHQKIRPEAGYHRLTVVDNQGHSITLPIIMR